MSHEFSSVPHESSAAATVGPAGIELFNDAGMSISVSEDAVEYWVSQGFRRNKLDLSATLSELQAFCSAAAMAAEEFVLGVQDEGVIDTADEAASAAAVMAFAKVFDLWVGLHADVHRLFPVKQGVGVKMLDADGAETEVDPGQVQLYLDKGFTEVS